MSDKEYEIPVKVIDRRWWANPDASRPAEAASASLKPTYVEELEKRLADKEREAQEYLAKYRGAADEFEKARLRLRREIAKDIERARREVIAELLDVADNLDRALESARQSKASGSDSPDALLQGVELVRRQFISKLEGLGVTVIDAERQPFDPTVHEAITSVPAPPDQDGKVLGVIRQGYRIGDDVLRPAAVAVGKASTVAQD